MKVSNKTYDLLNDIVKIGLPSIGAFYAAIAILFELGYAEAVVGSIAALSTLLGVWLKILKHNYSDPVDGVISVDVTKPESTEVRLAMENSDVFDKHNGDIVKFKIESNVKEKTNSDRDFD